MRIRVSSPLLFLVAGMALCFSVYADDRGQAAGNGDKSQNQAQPQDQKQNETSTPRPTSDQTGGTPANDATGDQSASDSEQSPVAEPHPKHDGGKNDVEAIGNRKVDGMNFYSIEKEIQMGRQFAQMLEKNVKLVTDPVINEYVNRVGQNLVRNSDAKVPFTIKVIDDDTINAMALPGGFFYVNSGLILAADDESEMAGAMAHEIAHVAARHITRTMTRAQLVNLMMIPASIVAGPGIGGYIGGQAANFGIPLAFLKFSRGFEAEADYLGLQYMYKTGYDPNGLVTIFEKIGALEKKKPGVLAKAFSDHPQTPDRVEKSQKAIARILPAREQYLVTTSEFDQVKARMARLENHFPSGDDEKTAKPMLRRSAEGPTPDGGDKDKDGDRPTLKRRDPSTVNLSTYRLSYR